MACTSHHCHPQTTCTSDGPYTTDPRLPIDKSAGSIVEEIDLIRNVISNRGGLRNWVEHEYTRRQTYGKPGTTPDIGSWTDSPLKNVPIKAVHLNEIDSKLDALPTCTCNCNQTSDIAAKKDIANIPSILDIVLKMRPVSFRYIDDKYGPPGISFGFIAQELLELFKNVDQHIVFKDKETNLYKVDLVQLIPILTAAIQELYKLVINNGNSRK